MENNIEFSNFLHPVINNYFIYIIIFILGYQYSEYIPKSYNSIIISSYSILYIGSFIYWYMDTHNGWWTNHKHNSSRKTPIEFLDLLPRVVINNILGYLCYQNILLSISKTRGLNDYNTNIFNIFINMIAIYLIFDFCFYFFHRLIHHPMLYSYIHKIHHSTFADIAISTHYMGLIDYLRPYTWDKQVESMVKVAASYPSTPSVIEPSLYAERLRKAVRNSFLPEVPPSYL